MRSRFLLYVGYAGEEIRDFWLPLFLFFLLLFLVTPLQEGMQVLVFMANWRRSCVQCNLFVVENLFQGREFLCAVVILQLKCT